MKATTEEKEITLIDLINKLKGAFSFLWQKKKVLLIVGAFGGILGLFYAVLKPVEYNSEVTFIVESPSKSGGLGSLGGLASTFGIGGLSGGDGGLFDNQTNLMKYLKSETILESVLLSELEHSGKTFAQWFLQTYEWKKKWSDSKILSGINFKLGEDRANFSLEKDSVLHSISQNLNEMIEIIKPEKEGSIISIKVSTRNDSLSKFLPERLISVVAERYIEMKTRLSQQNVNVLQIQTDSVRNVLYNSLHASAMSSDEVFGLNPAMAVRRVQANKEQIDVQASTILLGELIKNLELAKMKLKDQTPLIEIIDSTRFPLEKTKPGKIKFTILFGLLFGFVAALYLLIKRYYKTIIEKN